MAPQPPSKDLNEALANIQTNFTDIQSQLAENTSIQSTLEAQNDHLHSTFTSILDQVALLTQTETKIPHMNQQSSPHSNHSNQQPSTTPSIRPPTLDLSFFDGTNPLDWLFQADRYFSFNQIPLDQRIPMVEFHMQGDALSWFKWLHNNHLLTN